MLVHEKISSWFKLIFGRKGERLTDHSSCQAASGIGQDTGFAFAEAGARAVIFADIDFAGAAESVEQSRKYASNADYDSLAVEVNVADEASVQRMVYLAIAKFGRIDYNVNSAGVGLETKLHKISFTNHWCVVQIFNQRKSFKELDITELDRLYHVNVRGTALCMRYVLDAMSQQEPREIETRSGPRSLGKGCVVNLGSLSSHTSGSQNAPYIASKHAVLGLTKAAGKFKPFPSQFPTATILFHLCSAATMGRLTINWVKLLLNQFISHHS